MHVRLFNTDGRTLQEFVPLTLESVSMYTCGPTVYNYAHIGNLRSYIFADTLKRVLLFNGFRVRHIINITDVGHLTSDADEGEDKMLKGAQREGKTVWDVAQFYTDAFVSDFGALGLIDPEKFTRATDHIAEMIAMIKQLEENGFTYVANGNVYLDSSKVSDYGRLYTHKVDLQYDEEHSRVGVDAAKKHPTDFVLWFTQSKFEDQAMKWESPWGVGYPGWHIECSAMATKYLGKQIDIHTGGIDHITVHHSNEIAQSEGALGYCNCDKKWVQYWMHNEFVVVDDGKMSKSEDNFLRLQVLVDEGYSALDYKYFLHLAHYRKSVKFSFDALGQARAAHERLREHVLRLFASKDGDRDSSREGEVLNSFLEAVNDDLNVARGIGIMWDMLRDGNLSDASKYFVVLKMDEVFGLGLSSIVPVDVPSDVQKLVEQREEARAAKNWARADELRDAIARKGFVVSDGADGPSVREK